MPLAEFVVKRKGVKLGGYAAVPRGGAFHYRACACPFYLDRRIRFRNPLAEPKTAKMNKRTALLDNKNKRESDKYESKKSMIVFCNNSSDENVRELTYKHFPQREM